MDTHRQNLNFKEVRCWECENINKLENRSKEIVKELDENMGRLRCMQGAIERIEV